VHDRRPITLLIYNTSLTRTNHAANEMHMIDTRVKFLSLRCASMASSVQQPRVGSTSRRDSGKRWNKFGERRMCVNRIADARDRPVET
jgi:hypothetical protein